MLVNVVGDAGQEGLSHPAIATVRVLKGGAIRTKLSDPALLTVI
jgi:hypothetical protein